MKRRAITCLSIFILFVTGFIGLKAVAQNPVRHYIVLAAGQGAGSADFLDAIVAANGTITNVMEDIGVVTTDSSDPGFIQKLEVAPGVQAVAEDAELQWISPNEPAVQAEDPASLGKGANSEPYSRYQWNLRQIHADQTAANGDRGWGVVRARVAVLDSGIVTTHPDIAPNLNLELSRSFVPTEPHLDPPPGEFSHGTHVAGIIAAPINNVGVQGVAPRAEIVAVKVLRSIGSGSFTWLISGIEYAASPLVHADVINMSLGVTLDRINTGGDGAGPLIAALNRAITHATAAGSLCVSSAGNDAVNLDSRLISLPAQSGNGMAVSATGPYNQTNFDRLASYSNYGQSVINVAAPGGEDASNNMLDFILSPGGYQTKGKKVTYEYYFAAGTSMAAPHVSGLAALIVGKYGHMGPSQLETIIQQTADDILKPGADPQSGQGRINALSALQLAP